MAQPALGTRPATWSGSSNPILYKFTSTNYVHPGYRMVVEIWNSNTAAKIADAKYYSDSVGNVTVDVSSFLKANMSLANNSDLTSGFVYTDNNWIKYYIKYQEVWTASSESQVDDVANLRYAIYGGFQLGVINDYTDYIFNGSTTKKFLILSEDPKGSQGLPFTFNLIGNSSYPLLISKYINNVVTYFASRTLVPNVVNRIKVIETAYDRVEAVLVGATLATWSNGNVATAASPFNIIALGDAESAGVAAFNSNYINIAISGAINRGVVAVVKVTSSVLTGQVVFGMKLWDSTKTFSVDAGTQPIFSNGFYAFALLSSTFIPAYVELSLKNNSAGTVDWELEVYDEPASESISIELEEECNTVLLQWKNSLGGDECFPFCCNQEYTFHYSDRKAKRLTLYADNLTLSQWEAIQGLNTIGELYKTPITELTTTIDRTMATIGQAVYVLNSDGTKTGVNVIRSPNTTNTKQKKHSAFVTIEYPEQFLQ